MDTFCPIAERKYKNIKMKHASTSANCDLSPSQSSETEENETQKWFNRSRSWEHEGGHFLYVPKIVWIYCPKTAQNTLINALSTQITN